MKKLTGLLLMVFVAALAVPAFAGSGEKCSADAQTCLNHFSEYKGKGWVGLEYDKNEDGTMAVKSVIPNSPAATAGFKAGDILVALNGAKLTDKEAVKKAKGDWKPGAKVSYTVMRAKAEKQIAVTLGTMPEEVLAKMVGEHMLSSHVMAATAEATAK